MKHIFLFLLVLLLGVSVYSCKDEFVTDQPEGLILKNGSVLTDTELLGKYLFYDTNLSNPIGQSCATCHGPEVGYTGPHEAINKAGAVYEGAFPGRFGDRKPPSAAYGGDSPILHFDGDHWIGGMFWDGRATGWTLGDPLAEQALGPFLNPMEQNISSPADVIQIIKDSEYATLFESVYPGSLEEGDVSEAYKNVGRAIAAYERSAEVSSFTSKFDYFLAGKAKLTGQEAWGLQLFNGKGKCNLCHTSDGVRPLFTDFKYDNLGVPKNPLNPYYLANPDFVDYGLGAFLKSTGDPNWSSELGKHKVPTLRNVDKRPYKKFTKAYTHNGVFKSLEEVVHFYNTRDVGNWPAPEVAENVNNIEMGNLGLNLGEELAIVAFMKTLSDGYVLKK